MVDLMDDGGKATGTAIRYDELKSAIGYLESCPEKRPASSQSKGRRFEGKRPIPTIDDVKRIAAEVLQIESESRELAEEQELVAEKIEQTRPGAVFVCLRPTSCAEDGSTSIA